LELLAEKEDKDKKEEKDKKKGAARPPKLLEPYELSPDPFGEENDPSLPKMPSKDIDDSKAKDWSDERKEKASDQAELEYRIAKLKQLQFALEAYVAASQGHYRKALDLSHQCRPIINSMTRIEWLSQAGYPKKALDRIKKRIEEGPGELLPMAIGVWIAAQNNRDDEEVRTLAKQWLLALSPIAASADSALPMLERVLPAVDWIGEKGKWRVPGPAPTDVGDRPTLDSLGPFRWTPSLAPVWSATDSDGETRSTKQFGKRPLVMIFYLGMIIKE
jgi:hypothetical protein